MWHPLSMTMALPISLSPPPPPPHYLYHHLTALNVTNLVTVMELKSKLTHILKGANQAMDAHLREIKVVSDSLVAIQCPISQNDLVEYTLFVLDKDYDPGDYIETLSTRMNL